jgi:hypothetical protein
MQFDGPLTPFIDLDQPAKAKPAGHPMKDLKALCVRLDKLHKDIVLQFALMESRRRRRIKGRSGPNQVRFSSE